MSAVEIDEGAVTLRYTLTSEDLLDALTAQRRVVRSPWYIRWMVPLIVALVVAVSTLVNVLTGRLAGPALAVFVVLMVIMGVVATVVGRQIGPARWAYRLSVRQLMRGNPVFGQSMVTTVSPGGVTVSAPIGQTTSTWHQFPCHLETGRVFALLASDRLGGAVLVLPKRALDDTGTPALRALLAAHSRRLG